MRKMSLEVSQELGESTFCTTLDNGLKVYICQKKRLWKKDWYVWYKVWLCCK